LIFEKVYTYIPDFYAYYVMDEPTAKTMFNKLFMLREKAKGFEKIKEKFPFYVFYLVK